MDETIKANQQRMSIIHPSDVTKAIRETKTLARSVGFTDIETQEISIVVSELGTNLLKHAKYGIITITTSLKEEVRASIQIESEDQGPGIENVEQAIKNGISTQGTLGYGLGAVIRFMDEFSIVPHKEQRSGTHIVCKRWKKANVHNVTPSPLDTGIASRPHPQMIENGDSFIVKRWNNHLLIGLIDGLGHGRFAFQAAQTARNYIEQHYDQPLTQIFRGTDQVCRSTRGVVMVLAQFDFNRSQLSFAGVGNIEARIIGSRERTNFLVQRGVVGSNSPPLRVVVHPWNSDNVMILHSDGLSTRWRWEDFSHVATRSATHIAQELLRSLAKHNDDATVIVVKRLDD